MSKKLVSIKDFSKEEILEIFKLADKLSEAGRKDNSFSAVSA